MKCSKQEPSRRVLYPLPRSSNVLEVARSWKQRWVPSLGRAAGWEGAVGPGAVCSCRAAHVPSGMLVKQLERCHQCVLWEGVTKPVSPPEGRRAVCSCGMCWWAVPGVSQACFVPRHGLPEGRGRGRHQHEVPQRSHCHSGCQPALHQEL